MTNNKPLRTMEYSTDNLPKPEPTQDELRNFVRYNIGANMTILVEHLLEKEVFSYDDIVNISYLHCPECGGVMQDNPDTSFTCEDCGYTQDDEPDMEYKEVYEWWMVDEWMAEKLRQQGEVIFENDYITLWGRACTGQAIYMDSIIKDIYKSL